MYNFSLNLLTSQKDQLVGFFYVLIGAWPKNLYSMWSRNTLFADCNHAQLYFLTSLPSINFIVSFCAEFSSKK